MHLGYLMGALLWVWVPAKEPGKKTTVLSLNWAKQSSVKNLADAISNGLLCSEMLPANDELRRRHDIMPQSL